MGTRRNFLVGAAIATSLVACNSENHDESTTSSANGSEAQSNVFDKSNFDKIVSRSAPHRHCVGIAGIDGGEGLYAMNNTFATYVHSLSVPVTDVFLVGVLYRVDPVVIAFNDEVWNGVIIPAIPKLDRALRSNLESVRVTSGNPFLYRPPQSNGEDASVESLVARGATFFVCANATLRLAVSLGSALRQNPQTVYQALTGGLVNGATLVPTGVWAIQALQEAHFTYLQATI